MQPRASGGVFSGERLDRVAIEGVEIHVLAPAAKFEHEPPGPSVGRRRRRRREVEYHRFAGTKDGHRVILVGDERIDRAEFGVPAALVPRVGERRARAIVVLRRA